MHQNENKLQIDKLKLQQEETPQPSKEQEENHTSGGLIKRHRQNFISSPAVQRLESWSIFVMISFKIPLRRRFGIPDTIAGSNARIPSFGTR